MGFGGKKTPKPTESVFKDYNRANLSIDGLTDTSSWLDPESKTLKTHTMLTDGYGQGLRNLGLGIGQNTEYFMKTPEQRAADVTSGANPFYNALQLASDRQYQARTGEMMNSLARRGLGSSSILGGEVAQGAYQDAAQRLQNQLQAMEYLNSQYTNDLNTQVGAATSLGQLAMMPAQMQQDALLNMKMSQENKNTANDQMRIQAAAQKKSGLGSILGALGQVAGMALAAPTGGMSLAAGGALGGAIGGGVGSFWGQPV